ncbi:MAG: hypothetical protein KDA25_03735 [Phycisphaerales bacterium]|nr:hypothetical protein [Phycisphaerales bacterium]
MRVLIVHDDPGATPRTDDLDVLDQARHVMDALVGLGHEATIAPVGLDLARAAETIRSASPDVVFNLVESLGGHGRLIHVIPGLLDALRVPYTGCPAEAIFQTSNKLVAKRILAAHGVDTPRWRDEADLKDGHDLVEPRVIVKSVWEHASIGLDVDSVIPGGAAWSLRATLEERRASLGGAGFIESYIDGREFNIALLAGPDGPQVLPIPEIVFEGVAPGEPRVVGYRAKWDPSSFEYQHTPRRFVSESSEAPLLARLRTVARRCWSIFHLRGWARVDVRVDADGRVWVLEVNTNPCLSPDAGFVAAASEAGLEAAAVMTRLLVASGTF